LVLGENEAEAVLSILGHDPSAAAPAATTGGPIELPIPSDMVDFKDFEVIASAAC